MLFLYGGGEEIYDLQKNHGGEATPWHAPPGNKINMQYPSKQKFIFLYYSVYFPRLFANRHKINDLFSEALFRGGGV